MPQERRRGTDGDRTEREPPRDERAPREERAPRDEPAPPAEEQGPRRRWGFSEWFATTTARLGLALVGLVVFLFALGQAVGFDLLGLVAEAISTQTGQWLVVAFLGLLLIGAAQRGLPYYR